jgi:hypothetical protein
MLLWNDSEVHRLRLEIKHPDSIDENHIETPCAVQKQRIDSRYPNHRGSLFYGPYHLPQIELNLSRPGISDPFHPTVYQDSSPLLHKKGGVGSFN